MTARALGMAAVVCGMVACTAPPPAGAPERSATGASATGASAARTATAGAHATRTATAPPPMSEGALVAGQLPDAPEMNLLRSRCVICHGLDYVTQQRLTPAQWDKTLAKMKGWGAPVDEAEAKQLGRFLAHYWTPALPERQHRRAPAPTEVAHGR